MTVTEDLIHICNAHVHPGGPSRSVFSKLVLPEPYVPYIPKTWNGVLVLAEAQNLSNMYEPYRNRLLSKNPDQRIRRLYDGEGSPNRRRGIKPWDDDFLKVAVEAAFDERAEQTAVSNAVLWSLVDKSGKNENPNNETVGWSVEAWAELLPVLQPDRIIAAGKIAQKVVSQVKKRKAWTGIVLHLHLPSPRLLAVASGLFTLNDLNEHYPRAREGLDRHFKGQPPKKVRGHLLYACHAVSMALSIDSL